MSVLVTIDDLSIEVRKKMINDLSIKTISKNNKYSSTNIPFDVYEIVEDEFAAIPFGYYVQNMNLGFPNNNKEYIPMKAKFEMKLFDRQKEIKEETLQILNDNRAITLSLHCGWGKCLGPNTPILMWDGSIKTAKEIIVGDKLIGDDSTPRIVSSICNGKAPMFRIIQNKGDSYEVNESHILSLYISQHKNYFWSETNNRYKIEWLDKITLKIKSKIFTVNKKLYKTKKDANDALLKFRDTIDDDNILDINILDYLKLSTTTKDRLKGFKVGVNFPTKPVFLEPYLLGAWLGDGSSNGLSFTNIDDECLFEVKRQILEMDDRFIKYKDTITYMIRSQINYKRSNFKKELNLYNLTNNKHIPKNFLINNRNTRLELLAGLIDTDGYLKEDSCYEIVQKNKQLAIDILYLVRSLGFSATFTEVEKTCTNSVNGPVTGTYYKCVFSGIGLHEIPCRIPRKKASIRKQIKNALVTFIKVEPLDVGEYYGFTIDGNHRFLLGDFTVTHNTYYSVYLACKIKLKTMIFIHRIILIDQWKQSIIKACGENTKIQILTAKTKIDPDMDFYIINILNVMKRNYEDFTHIGLLIADEFHCLCTEKYGKAFRYIFPKYFIGLTATPIRTDQKDRLIELYIGPNNITKPLNVMFNAYLVYSKFMPKVESTDSGQLNWNSVLESQCKNKNLNELIIDLIRHFSTRNILVLCKRKDHATILHESLIKYNVDADTFMGSKVIVNYDCRVLIATYSKSGVGFDHKKLDMLIVAGDVEEQFIQYLGRVFRREYHFPIIIDFMHKFRPLKKHTDARCEIYKNSGGQIKRFENYFSDFEIWRKKFNTDITDIYKKFNIEIKQ
jgi:superfamily II DNA or RNA helicase